MSAYAVENRRRRWFTGEEHTNMKLTIPSNAEKILHILEENGYEAYVVGGCVRDSILGLHQMTGILRLRHRRSR